MLLSNLVCFGFSNNILKPINVRSCKNFSEQSEEKNNEWEDYDDE